VNTLGTSMAVARENVDALLEEVRRRENDLAVFLPEGVSRDRFMALARRAVLEQPALAECTPGSVLRALRECALSGLELDGRFSTLIVRRPKNGRPVAVWSPSYPGLIWQCLATGLVRAVQAEVVHAADVFEVTFGTESKIVHRPLLTGPRGDLVACYATAEMTSGARVVELLTAEDIRKIAAMSPAGERGPWGSWPAEMWKKCAIRRLTKRLPAGSTRAPVAIQTRANVDALRQVPAAGVLEPEHEHALECRALERLSDARTVEEIDAVWHQAVAEHQQQRAAVPLSVEARWRELREQLGGQAEP
jgi:recombination protein RecT